MEAPRVFWGKLKVRYSMDTTGGMPLADWCAWLSALREVHLTSPMREEGMEFFTLWRESVVHGPVLIF
jgi:hypothetical protein